MIQKPAKIGWWDLLLLTGIGVAALWWAHRANAHIQYQWNWQVIPQYLFRFDAAHDRWVPGLITQGVLVTLRLSIWASVLSLAMGTIMGLFRTSRSRYLRMVGAGYVAVIRNIPVLVWIFIFYYFIGDRFLPILGIDRLANLTKGPLSVFLRFAMDDPSRLTVFLSGTLALALYEGAYMTEIIRAGIQSIDRGQWEASLALGFTRSQQLRYVIFPQALVRVTPPMAGQFISTIKDSAIVSVISIQELTFQGMELMAATFLTFEVWLTILAIYFVVCLTCSLLVERFESWLNRKTGRHVR